MRRSPISEWTGLLTPWLEPGSKQARPYSRGHRVLATGYKAWHNTTIEQKSSSQKMTIRLSRQLLEALPRLAQQNRRSLNGEVEWRLSRSVQGIVMKQAFKFRLYPDASTEQHLSWTLTRCRELYNAGLSERKDAYQAYQRMTIMQGSQCITAAIMMAGRQIKPMSFYSQKRDLVEIKAERPEYQEIASHVLQDVLNRLDKAFAAFFRRVKTGGRQAIPASKGATATTASPILMERAGNSPSESRARNE